MLIRHLCNVLLESHLVSLCGVNADATELDSPQGGLQRRNNKGSSSSSNSSSSMMEVDEEDAEIIKETKKMGYCYFRRDLTEEEKRLNAQNRPTKISSDGISAPSAVTPSGETEKVLGHSRHFGGLPLGVYY